VYLEPIFTQDDVVANLRDQKKTFDDVNHKFKKTMGFNVGQTLIAVNDFVRAEGFV